MRQEVNQWSMEYLINLKEFIEKSENPFLKKIEQATVADEKARKLNK